MIKYIFIFIATAIIFSAEEDRRPPQYRVWGTVAPAETDAIVAPAPYRESLPANFEVGPAIHSDPETMARGFLPFRRHAQSLLHPRLRPGPADLADTALASFASQGEYASLCLGVHALRELVAIQATITDLEGEGGRLNAINFDLRWVKFLPNPVARFVYRLDPQVLEKRQTKTLEIGTSAFLWLTLYVPPGTPPGVYRGSLRLAAFNCPEQRVPLSFRVLDLELDPPDKHLAMLYAFSRPGVAAGDPTRLNDELIDMAMHGMNSLSYIQISPQEITTESEPRFDFSLPSRIGSNFGLSPRYILDVARDAGLRRDAVLNLAMIPSYSHLWTGASWGSDACDDHLRRLATAWAVEGARAGNWPRLMFNIGDEPTNRNGRLEPARRIGSQVKKGAPSLLTTCFCVGGYLGEDDLAVLDSVLDVAVVPVLPKVEYRDSLLRRGKPFWLYNSARPDRPLDARMSFGWYIYDTGADGMEQFMYRQVGCSKVKGAEWNTAFIRWPEKGFEDLEPAWCYSWRVEDGCLPSPSFESIRAGVTDLRYIQTAARLAARAVADSRLEVRQLGARAQGRLAAFRGEFAYFLPGGSFRGVDWLHAAGTELLDLRRWELAQLILSLRGYKMERAAISTGLTSARIALTGVRCQPAVSIAALRPLALAAASCEGIGSSFPFSVLGSSRAGEILPARYQTKFSVCVNSTALSFYISADEPDGERPKRVDGGIWSQDGVEIFLSSPSQDGLVHQIAVTALGDVGLLTHRRVDRVRTELAVDHVAVPPPGLVANVERVPRGWRLEAVVPWSALGLSGPPLPGEVWGFNLCRTRRGNDLGGATERSSWVPLEGRFLEPAAFGHLAMISDPGISSLWSEVVEGKKSAFLVLEIENRGLARTIFLEVEGERHGRTVSPGVSRLIVPLSDPLRSRVLAIRADGGVIISTVMVSPISGGNLEVAGVGSRRGDGVGGRVARPALSLPSVVWPHARAIPLGFDFPVNGSRLSGKVNVFVNERLVLSQPLNGLDSARGCMIFSSDGLASGSVVNFLVEIDGVSFSSDVCIGEGFL